MLENSTADTYNDKLLHARLNKAALFAREFIAAYNPGLIDTMPNYIGEALTDFIADRIGEDITYIQWPELMPIEDRYRGIKPGLKAGYFKPGMLKVSLHNSKIEALADYTKLVTAAIDLRAGHSCPAADICRGKIVNGRIEAGPRAIVKCFAVKLEAVYPNVYRAHEYNENTLRAAVKSGQAADILAAALAPFNLMRLHSSGDIFSIGYGEALANAARAVSDTLIFGYTKFAPALKINWPDNVKLQYSIGGVYDRAIDPAVTPSNFIVMPGDLTLKLTDNLARAIVIHNGRLYSIPLQVNKFDDFNFIRAGVTFGITLH